MRLSSRFIITLFFSLALSSLGHAENAAIEIEGAWVREGPPSATVLAGYLSIRNASKDTTYLLEGVDSPQFAVVEMHESYEENGISRMRKHDQLPLPPQGELRFTPNGFHLMLMDPPQAVRAGSEVTLGLKFRDLAPMTIKALVKRAIE